MKARIAVLPGDGIGPEIVPQAVQILEAVAAQYGHTFEFHAADVGGAAIDKTGRPLPEETLKLAKESDAILLGAVGGPKWDGLAYEVRPERALLGLRERLGPQAAEEGHLGGQSERPRIFGALAARGPRCRQGLSGRRASAPLRGQLRHAAHPQPEAVRRARDHQPVRRHPER